SETPNLHGNKEQAKADYPGPLRNVPVDVETAEVRQKRHEIEHEADNPGNLLWSAWISSRRHTTSLYLDWSDRRWPMITACAPDSCRAEHLRGPQCRRRTAGGAHGRGDCTNCRDSAMRQAHVRIWTARRTARSGPQAEMAIPD